VIRKGFGCGLALVSTLALVIAGLVVAPLVVPRVPSVISAVKHEVSALQSDIKGKPSPGTWPSGPPAQPTPWAKSEPTAPPVISVGTSWVQPSPANCQWGGGILAQDAQLDLQGAVTYPSLSSWYHETAGWWEVAQNDLLGLCGQGPEPTAAACLADVAHFQTGQASHQAAASNTTVPDNTQFDQQWNAQWISNYSRLMSIWSSTGCAQQVGN